MAQKHIRAFTLVEVLIVIIIIGILAGLIMLSSGSATDTAERTRCVADRRSLRSALYIFRVEKGGTTSADLSATLKEVLEKMFDNGQGTVSGDSEIDGICPTKGIYAVTVSDDKYLIACSVHGGDGGSGSGGGTGTGGGSGTGGDGGGGTGGGTGGDSGGTGGDVSPSGSLILTDSESNIHQLKITGKWEDVLAEAAASSGGIPLKAGSIFEIKDGRFYVIGWGSYMQKDGSVSNKDNVIEVSSKSEIYTVADTVNGAGIIWNKEMPKGSFCKWNGEYYIAPGDINVNTFPEGGWVKIPQ